MAGKLLIAQSGGPTAVINATLAGVLREARKHKIEVSAAIGGIEGLLKERFYSLRNIPDDEIELLKYSPACGIGSGRYKVTEKDHAKICAVLKSRHYDYFFYNGGNDSMDTCHKVASFAKDVCVIGLPKTIDNDLCVTDHCPGFGSAARYTAVSVRELGLDVRSMPIHICIIELMGRNAGWITASAALARKQAGDAPHLIYLPERPFIEDQFLEDAKSARAKYGGVVIAVSEGVVNQDGQPVVATGGQVARDAFGHALAGSVGEYLASLIREKLNIRARSEKPGILARCSSLLASAVDRQEAYQTGIFAVKKAIAGNSGYMVGYQRISNHPYRIEYKLINLAAVANKEKTLPDNFIAGNNHDVTKQFINYVKPLIGKEIPEYYKINYEDKYHI